MTCPYYHLHPPRTLPLSSQMKKKKKKKIFCNRGPIVPHLVDSVPRSGLGPRLSPDNYIKFRLGSPRTVDLFYLNHPPPPWGLVLLRKTPRSVVDLLSYMPL